MSTQERQKGLDKESLVPLHVQLSVLLKREIEEAKYTEKIPPEFELMKRFDVSRSTVRQAIKTLVDEGVLEKRQGLGTFIAIRPVEEWLGNLSTYMDVVRDMGKAPYIMLLDKGFTSEPLEIADCLGAMGDFYFVHRLRYADHIPLAYEEQYYPLWVGKELDKYDLNNVATYDVLENQLNQTLSEARQQITCAPLSEREKRYLNIDNDECYGLLSERFVYNSNSELLEFERVAYRADMYAFNINLTRKRRV